MTTILTLVFTLSPWQQPTQADAVALGLLFFCLQMAAFAWIRWQLWKRWR